MAEDEKNDPKWSEVLKKLFAAGVSGAMLSEDAIRGYLADVKLPKDLANLVLQGAQKSKDEVTQRVSKEIINLVRKIDLVKEVSRFAEDHKFKITAEIEVTRKNKAETSKSASVPTSSDPGRTEL